MEWSSKKMYGDDFYMAAYFELLDLHRDTVSVVNIYEKALLEIVDLGELGKLFLEHRIAQEALDRARKKAGD